MVAANISVMPAEGDSGPALVCGRVSILRPIYDRTKRAVQWPPWAVTAYYGGSSNPAARNHWIPCFLLITSQYFNFYAAYRAILTILTALFV